MNIQQKVLISNMKEFMISLTEFIKLFWLNLLVQKRNFFEFLKVACHYYSHFEFAKIDFSLLMIYLFHSPFTLSKRFLEKSGKKDIYAYGETPLTSLEKIVYECRVTEKDTIFELGCGRGRTCFWLRTFVKCKVVGIDYIPGFIEKANLLKKRFHLRNIEFRLQDFLNADFKGATVVYLYGTCLEERDIKKLIEKFKQLPTGTKIITVSYPLTDYIQDSPFEVMQRFPAIFTWGKADVYMHLKK